MTSTQKIEPGDKITILGPLSLPNPAGGASGIAYQRGSVIEVTATLLEESRDRTGASLFDNLSDEQQTARWGRPLIAVGDVSATTKWWEGDASSAKIARDRARDDAAKIPDPAERATALQAVRDEFGPDTAASGQQTTMRVAGDNPHALQDDRR